MPFVRNNIMNVTGFHNSHDINQSNVDGPYTVINNRLQVVFHYTRIKTDSPLKRAKLCHLVDIYYDRYC